jgi:hypothetical protein
MDSPRSISCAPSATIPPSFESRRFRASSGTPSASGNAPAAGTATWIICRFRSESQPHGAVRYSTSPKAELLIGPQCSDSGAGSRGGSIYCRAKSMRIGTKSSSPSPKVNALCGHPKTANTSACAPSSRRCRGWRLPHTRLLPVSSRLSMKWPRTWPATASPSEDRNRVGPPPRRMTVSAVSVSGPTA